MPGDINWIDCVIALCLVGAAFGAYRLGLIAGLCIIATTTVALFFFGWLWPQLLPIDDPMLKTIINADLVLLSTGYAGIKGFELGRTIHWRFFKAKWRHIESWLGIVPGVVAALVSIWLLAALLGWLPFAGLSNSVNDSRIVQWLQRSLPSVPVVLMPISRQIDPNTPAAPALPPPPHASFAYGEAEVQSATRKTAGSVVRLTGFGCGGLSNGTGFAIGKNLIMTNAHVVAGVRRPIVKHQGHSYEAYPVFFNAGLDVAVLRVDNTVHNFVARPLLLHPAVVTPDTSVAVVGYPNGAYAVSPGIVRNDLRITSQSIYGFAAQDRSTYTVQTTVALGSSGSPVVLADGTVAGVIYAQYNASADYAAAIASHYLTAIVEQAQQSQRRVGTGACLAT